MLAYGVPTTPLRRMGADRVIGLHLSPRWDEERTPRHVFEVIGQCFSIAQSRLCESWVKDADLVIEPVVDGFSYDCFERAPELIAAGEAAMRAALPQLREMLSLPKCASQKIGFAPVTGPATPQQASPAV